MTKGRKKADIRPKHRTVKKQQLELHDSDVGRDVPIVRTLPPNYLPTLFCDGLVIQHTEDTFVLSFLQTQQPLAVTDEERAKVKHIEQLCLVRIILTPAQMAKNIFAMDKNFSRFLAKTPLEAKDFKEYIEYLMEQPENTEESEQAQKTQEPEKAEEKDNGKN